MNNRIYLLVLLIYFSTICSSFAQIDSVHSGVYDWPSLNKENPNQLIFEGKTKDLENITIFADAIQLSEIRSVNANELEDETMLIFKNGKSKLTFDKTVKILGPGSIAIIYPGVGYQIENVGSEQVEYYLFRYKSKDSHKIDNNKEADKSFYVDWDEIEFQPHDKGGVRQYCEVATKMFNYFSMHVTTLNPGIKSHEPHTHGSDEMVIMINGNTGMEIGDSKYNAKDGDVYFLGAGIPHAISNVGEESCMYYAFHWE